MSDLLSLWRSPLDRVAETKARELAARQPRCDYPINLAPVLTNPQLDDTVPIYHQADGNGYQVALQSIGELIGGGGGPVVIGPATDFSALTIYNYATYGALSSGGATVNATAMLSMLTAAQTSPQGGLCIIPQFQYPIPASNFSVPYNTVMMATGQGGFGAAAQSLYHFNVQGDGTLFTVTGPHNFGGTSFIGLSIAFNSAVSGTSTAIHADSGNVKMFRCSFNNTPIAVNFTGPGGLSDCVIQYSNGPNGFGPGGAGLNGNEFAAVIMNSSQTFCQGPGEYLQAPQSGGGSPPTNTNCIGILNHSEHANIFGLHISHWSYGITYGMFGGASGGANYDMISNCEFSCWTTCVYMQPPVGNMITGEKFTACTFVMDNGSTSVTPVFYIDTNGQPNQNIFDISLIGCTINQGLQHGLQINTGTFINVIGGTYSGNGNVTTAGGVGGAGIAITGACGQVSITNANLGPGYTPMLARNQTWALLITSSPTNRIFVNNCYMGGYSQPVSVTGTPTNLFIINCTGYNDQNTLICNSGGTNAPLVATSASQGATLTNGVNYYGPSLVIFTTGASPLTFHYNASSQTVPANQYVTIFLASPYDTILFSAAPSAFNWFGK
jgi:hypothetical protein